MLKKNNIKKNIAQIYSLVVKDLKLRTRFKTEFFVEFFYPFLALFTPFIIFSTLFTIDVNIFEGYYSSDNFILFLLLGYCSQSCIFLLWYYRDLFYDEKTWKTLNGILVAPVNKFNILFGYYISSLISRGLEFIIIIIICFILYPIPLINLFFTFVMLFCISITFAAMGFLIGLFEIINENISASLTIGISFISIISCLFYPIDIFPERFQFIILLNPLYYYFDLIRLIWWVGIDNSALNYITIWHILIVATFTIITPIFASFYFRKIVSKYGIQGY